jgi:hypothetical protein
VFPILTGHKISSIITHGKTRETDGVALRASGVVFFHPFEGILLEIEGSVAVSWTVCSSSANPQGGPKEVENGFVPAVVGNIDVELLWNVDRAVDI